MSDPRDAFRIHPSKLNDEQIDALILAVYRARVDANWKGDADRELAKVGEKIQRSRAQAYRGTVLEVLRQLDLAGRA